MLGVGVDGLASAAEAGTQQQTITFSAPPSPAVAGGSYKVSATSSAGLPVELVLVGACSSRPLQADSETRLGEPARTHAIEERAGTSPVTIYFHEAGGCTIYASARGNAEYRNGNASQSFMVAKDPSEHITFLSSPPQGATVGESYDLVVRSSAGIEVAFSSETRSVCGLVYEPSVAIRLMGPGTCTIDARQLGSAESEAPEAEQSFSVAPDVVTASAIARGETYDVALACPATKLTYCEDSVVLEAKAPRRARTRSTRWVGVGKVSQKLLGGEQMTQAVRLNGTGRRLLRKLHKLTLKYTVTTSPEALTGTIIVAVKEEPLCFPRAGAECRPTFVVEHASISVARVGSAKKTGPNQEVLSSIATKEDKIAVAPGEYAVALGEKVDQYDEERPVTVTAGQTVEVVREIIEE